LQIDCYNEILDLGFEYNEKHHYLKSHYFNKNNKIKLKTNLSKGKIIHIKYNKEDEIELEDFIEKKLEKEILKNEFINFLNENDFLDE
jgi:hypothetical protein